ncbi:NfeD family protein [Hydrogenoanaerobacterium sp.]|uniref:NfeD family protein n=1 Tax=Hydrogenoanaerobacterium sp. TaxID=2953763 RepID=UPI00289FB5C7|nr:NfeD family protein [Hydrogenoanaerobacterium sp.]
MRTILSQELYPVFWLILGIALAIAEAATVQLVAIWFSLGAVAAIIPALMGAPVWAQFLVFVAVSALAMVGTRPFVKRFLNVKQERTNADRVIGQTGVVLQEIDNDRAQGRVLVMGLDWSARSVDGTDIPVDAKVTILAIEGVKLIVEAKEILDKEELKEEQPCY